MNFTFLPSWDNQTLNRIPRTLISLKQPLVGQKILIGVPNGPWGHVAIHKVTQESIWALGSLDKQSHPPSPLSVGIGLSRPKMMKRNIKNLVELGVKEIHIFKSFFSEKSYLKSHIFNPEQLHYLAREALEQVAEDTLFPRIETHKYLRPFLEDVVLKSFSAKNILCADPFGDHWNSLNPSPQFIIFGPEKGFSKNEISLMNQLNIPVKRFGSRSMRQETAVTAICGNFTFSS